MLSVPKKVSERLSRMLGRYQTILTSAKDRDINETDTVHIIKDMLADLFGFDKYSEITSEFSVKNTFCDLAVKLADTVEFLIEAKAIGRDLKESHLKQAIDYGANKGIPWVVLTNGICWQLHMIKFEQPITSEMVFSICMLDASLKKDEDQEKLYVLSKEGVEKDARGEYYKRTQCVNRYILATILTDEPIVNAVRKEIRRIYPEVKVDPCEILALLKNDVIKRELTESEEALKVQAVIKKIYQKIARVSRKSETVITLDAPSANTLIEDPILEDAGKPETQESAPAHSDTDSQPTA